MFPLVILLAAAAAAIAGKALAGKSLYPDPNRMANKAQYKGQIVDTSIDQETARTGSKLALSDWARAQGFVLLDEAAARKMYAGEMGDVLRMFSISSQEYVQEKRAPAAFTLSKGVPLTGMLSYPVERGQWQHQIWILPP